MTPSQEIIKVKGLKKQRVVHKAMQSEMEYLNYLAGIQVSGMFHCSGVISIVSLLYHRIKQLSKYLMGN